ncbi:MAG: hypothetical protein LBG24_05345 [Treponema sp.]|nr:hypothetical protein [Treponema sp.]
MRIRGRRNNGWMDPNKSCSWFIRQLEALIREQAAVASEIAGGAAAARIFWLGSSKRPPDGYCLVRIRRSKVTKPPVKGG